MPKEYTIDQLARAGGMSRSGVYFRMNKHNLRTIRPGIIDQATYDQFCAIKKGAGKTGRPWAHPRP